MNAKKLLSIAIITMLPIVVHADYSYTNMTLTPAEVADNGTVTMAQNGAPYVTVSIENNDDEHVASTAYVKGAYNDTIAAINRVYYDKQTQLVAIGGEYIDTGVIPTDLFFEDYLTAENMPNTIEQQLVTAGAVINGIRSQRVEVYTNWDDDDATTDVAFKTVVPE